MANTEITGAFSRLETLRDQYENLGMFLRDAQVNLHREEMEKRLYVLHYQVWSHAYHIRDLMNKAPISEPILNGRFEIVFPELTKSHHKVAKHVLSRYLKNKVETISGQAPVGFEFSYDHPKSTVSILAERNNLKSVNAARNLAVELVAYSSAVKCPLSFNNQAFRTALPPKPMSIAQKEIVLEGKLRAAM